MAMSYQEKVKVLLGTLGQKVAQQLVTDKRDLFLSLDEGSVFESIASYARLHADDLEFDAVPDSVLVIYRNILGILLHTGKIVPQFSLSKRGKEQLDSLTAAFRPALVDPKIAEYQKFNEQTDTVDYQLRLSADEGFRNWANGQSGVAR